MEGLDDEAAATSHHRRTLCPRSFHVVGGILDARLVRALNIRSMKSLNDKARAERVVATLTRLRSVYDVGTVKLELETQARGDARHERRDPGNEHHDAYIAIQALRKQLVMASADVQTLWP